MLTTNPVSLVSAVNLYHCQADLTLNLYGSYTRFDNSDIAEDQFHQIFKCDPSPASYQDRCFVSIFGEKILSSIKSSAKSLSNLFSSPSKSTEDSITNPPPSVYSEITRVFQEYAKPCFEIRIGQDQTVHSHMGQFNLLDLSLTLGNKILRKKDYTLDLVSRELNEKEIGGYFSLSREIDGKRVYLSALPKPIQNTVISLLINGRPAANYDCFQFLYDCIGDDRVESDYKLIPYRDIESRLSNGDFVYMSKGREAIHAAIYLGNDLFLSVLGSGGGLGVVESKELMKAYKADSIYKIQLTSYIQELPRIPFNTARYIIEEEDRLKTYLSYEDTFVAFAQRLISREQEEKNGYILKAHENQVYQKIEIYLHNQKGYLPISIHPNCQNAILNLLKDSSPNHRRFFDCIASTHKTPFELPGKAMYNVRCIHSMGDLIVIRDKEDAISLALYLFNGLVLHETFYEEESTPYLLVTTIDQLLHLKKGTTYGAHGPLDP